MGVAQLIRLPFKELDVRLIPRTPIIEVFFFFLKCTQEDKVLRKASLISLDYLVSPRLKQVKSNPTKKITITAM